MFYGDDNTVRAKFEGIDEINDGFKKGIIKAVIENFTERRKKLKMAERLAENFASGLALHMLVGMMASSSDDEEDKKVTALYSLRIKYHIASFPGSSSPNFLHLRYETWEREIRESLGPRLSTTTIMFPSLWSTDHYSAYARTLGGSPLIFYDHTIWHAIIKTITEDFSPTRVSRIVVCGPETKCVSPVHM